MPRHPDVRIADLNETRATQSIKALLAAIERMPQAEREIFFSADDLREAANISGYKELKTFVVVRKQVLVEQFRVRARGDNEAVDLVEAQLTDGPYRVDYETYTGDDAWHVEQETVKRDRARST